MPVTHKPKGPGGGQFAPGGGAKGGAAKPTPTNQNPVGMGEQSQRVKDLQARLNAMGAHLKVDGQFGPKTRAAVVALQRKYGLKTDGLVGPKTTAALRGQSEGRRNQKNLKKIVAKQSGQKQTTTKPSSAPPAKKQTTYKASSSQPANISGRQ